MEALFGKELIVIDTSKRKIVGTERNNKGAFIIPPSKKINSRVSGILFCQKISPWIRTEMTMRLFHNPWGKLVYEGPLCTLDQVIPGDNEMQLKEGLKPSDIFGFEPFPAV